MKLKYAQVYSPHTGQGGTPAVILDDTIFFRLPGLSIMSVRCLKVIDGDYVSNLGQGDIHIEVLNHV